MDLISCGDHGRIQVVNTILHTDTNGAVAGVVRTLFPTENLICTVTYPFHARQGDVRASVMHNAEMMTDAQHYYKLEGDAGAQATTLTRLLGENNPLLLSESRAPFGLRGYFPTTVALVGYNVGMGCWRAQAHGLGGVKGVVKMPATTLISTTQSDANRVTLWITAPGHLILQWRGLWWEVLGGSISLVALPLGIKMTKVGTGVVRQQPTRTQEART